MQPTWGLTLDRLDTGTNPPSTPGAPSPVTAALPGPMLIQLDITTTGAWTAVQST